MEHRWSMRRALAGEARIYRDGVQILESPVGDIGLEGIFIRTGSIGLGRNALVEVEFALPGERAQAHRLPATVAHRSEAGVGLMFQTFDPQAFRAIQTFLYEPHREE